MVWIMPEATELREFFEKVLSRHFEYHPDEFDDEYAKFSSSAPTPTTASPFDTPPPPPPSPPPSDTSSPVSAPPSVNG